MNLPMASQAISAVPIRITTLGLFEVHVCGARHDVGGARIEQLLRALIAFGGEHVSHRRLTDALWPDSEGDAGRRVFDTTLHRLRRRLNVDGALEIASGCLTLSRRRCWVDAWALDSIVARSTHRRARVSTSHPPSAETIFELYGGRLFGDVSDESWAVSPREELHARVLDWLCQKGGAWEAAGQWDAAAALYRRALSIDDLHEPFHRGLLRCHAGLDQRAEFRRSFQRCRDTLRAALGLEPSRETLALAKRFECY